METQVEERSSLSNDAPRVNLAAAREVADEMQRGLVKTHIGHQHIVHVSKRTVTEAWKQAGQVIEALVNEAERA